MRKSAYNEHNSRQREINKADKFYRGYVIIANFIQRGIDIQKSKISKK